jgi:hypothetical protein
MSEPKIHDPYKHCESAEGCTHDLVRGVLVSELLSGDGPFPDMGTHAGPANVREWLERLRRGTQQPEG